MTGPQIRAELLIIATMVAGPIGQRIAYLAGQTKKRSPIRRAPRQRYAKVTYAQVMAYLAVRPTADYQEIAMHYGSNIGRVSEALHGFRT